MIYLIIKFEVKWFNLFSCFGQEERLQRLQERLQVPYDETNPDHQVSTSAFHEAIYMSCYIHVMFGWNVSLTFNRNHWQLCGNVPFLMFLWKTWYLTNGKRWDGKVLIRRLTLGIQIAVKSVRIFIYQTH
jgi:hypothetical protein